MKTENTKLQPFFTNNKAKQQNKILLIETIISIEIVHMYTKSHGLFV